MNSDISFLLDNQKFNFRVGAVIIHENRILAMRDSNSPYFYLPGGRVKIGENTEAAIIRELQEELGILPKIERPLWLNQSFFTEDVSLIRFHELCLYYLIDISNTDILSRGAEFYSTEKNISNYFKWIDFEELQNEYFYPAFLKKKIFFLPKELTIITEAE